MRFIDEYRDPDDAARLARKIRRTVTRPWRIMEICGGQTHAIVRFGMDELLPPELSLIHGPGCPVCVTPAELIDKAIEIASQPQVTFCTFGDMMRVPGTRQDLLSVKAGGGDVRMVYSPLDAVRIAGENPNREVVFFAVGFETTAPANAMAVLQAQAQGLTNFSLLVSHVLVPPAIEAILGSPDCQVNGFLAAGHVCAVMGYAEYEPIAARFGAPIVVTGFEPTDILRGIATCATLLEEGRPVVENAYARVVRREGNRPAQEAIRRVFRVSDRKWRGIGFIPESGLAIREELAAFDAERRFGPATYAEADAGECLSGLVLRGIRKPHECPAFGTRCTPEHPLGATMVSSEGACAAYYRYRRTGAISEATP